MNPDVISVVASVFCLCVCITLAAEAKTLFSAKATIVAVAKAP